MTVLEDSTADPPRYRCSVDESCFEPPSDYVVIGGDCEDGLTDGAAGVGYEEEDQFAYAEAWDQYFSNGQNGAAPQVLNGSTATPEQVTFMEALRTNQVEVDPELQK